MVGLINPALVDIAPVLVPLAATGLATIMAVAAIRGIPPSRVPADGVEPDLSRMAVFVV